MHQMSGKLIHVDFGWCCPGASLDLSKSQEGLRGASSLVAAEYLLSKALGSRCSPSEVTFYLGIITRQLVHIKLERRMKTQRLSVLGPAFAGRFRGVRLGRCFFDPWCVDCRR
jgi:hypothetical protein